MTNEEFYHKCAELLGVEYDCKPFQYRYRTRWNNRKPGSGRYPGFGIIRKFGNQIHVALTYPITHTHVYHNEDEVFELLQNLNNNITAQKG